MQCQLLKINRRVQYIIISLQCHLFAVHSVMKLPVELDENVPNVRLKLHLLYYICNSTGPLFSVHICRFTLILINFGKYNCVV